MPKATTKRPTRAPKSPTPGREVYEPYAMGTVMVGEGMSRQFSFNPTDNALVRRCVQQTMAWAVAFNAMACAQQKLRLFRTTKAKGKALWAGKRVTNRKMLRHLRGEGLYDAGTKALELSNEGDVEEVLDHPALTLFRQPDPFQTSIDFMETHFWGKEAVGRSYTCKAERGSDGTPVSLYNLLPAYMTVQPDERTFIRGYWYGRNTVAQRMYTPADVIYHRHMTNKLNPLEAYSWPSTLQMESDCEMAAVQSEVAKWNNGGQPGMIVSIDGTPPSPTARAQIESDWARQVKGVQKHGGAFFIFGKASVTQGTDSKEMQYVEGLTKIEKRIYRAAGIPDSIVEMSKSNLANAWRADPQYCSQVILPRINKSAEEFNLWLLYSDFDLDPGEYFFAFDNPVKEDEVAAVDRAVKLVTAGIIRREVIAAELGYLPEDVGTDPNAVPEPVEVEDGAEQTDPEGGDTTVDGTVAAPTGRDVQAEALNGAQVTALAELASQVALGQLPERSARAIARAAFPLVSDELLTEIFGGLEAFEPEPDPTAAPPDNTKPPNGNGPSNVAVGGDGAKALGTELTRGSVSAHERGGSTASGADHGSTRAHDEARFPSTSPARKRLALEPREGCECGHPAGHIHGKATEPETSLGQLKAKLEAWLKATYPEALQPDGSVVLTPAQEQDLQAILGPVIREYMEEGASATAGKLGGEWGGIATNPRALEWAEQHAAEAVRDIADTTRAELNAAVTSGLQESRTLNEIQADIRERVPEIASARAEVIARTETATAYNRGGVIAAKENGYTHKQIDLAGGSCPTCEAVVAAHPEGVPIDGSFMVEGTPMYSSPLHPNCRCATTFEDRSEG